MSIENRFNLIDEPWVSVTDIGLVSLKQIFSDRNLGALGGTPIQKIALTKLLLAIVQSAYTPIDNDDWESLGSNGMASRCLAYLDQWHDRFWLYGEKPFLQMSGIQNAECQPFGALLPEIATGNSTILFQSTIDRSLTDAERAVLIVVLMGFALGGKKTDNSVVLSHDYLGKNNDKGKPKTGSPGPSIGFIGFMHNFLIAENIQETLWLNLLSVEQIKSVAYYPAGLGQAPWEIMPAGESCPVAQNMKKSLMGRLLPLSRFCLLADRGLHYSEGIAHLGYKDGGVDPTIAVDFSGKDPKVLWVNPEKRPWRQLTALLSFMSSTNTVSFECIQVRFGFLRARQVMKRFGVWSGGMKVRSNAGEQYLTGLDDFVESIIFFQSSWLGECWYERLKLEVHSLDEISKKIFAATCSFFKEQNISSKDQADLATNFFWQLCERKFQMLVNCCNEAEEVKDLRKTFASFALKAYDATCSKETARQLDAWAKNRPNLSHYLT